MLAPLVEIASLRMLSTCARWGARSSSPIILTTSATISFISQPWASDGIVALPSNPSLFVSLGIAALIAWRIYRRVRRMVGRQRLSSVRPWITVSLFPVLIALPLLGSIPRPSSALALVVGVGLGAGLGIYGLRLTKFEETPAGLYYTPNAHLGIGLSLLFLGRVAYRAIRLYASEVPVTAPPVDFVRSPLTLLIFGTLAGYYVAYAIGLLRWRSRARLSNSPATSERPNG
jgi:hypothetical protein